MKTGGIALAGVLVAGAAATMNAQVAKPAAQAPTPQAASTQTRTAQATFGNGPTELVNRAKPFPKPNPRNFTATSPDVATVNAFLQQLWGYDTNREWSVAAILKTPSEGVARVVVFVADKRQPGKQQETVFFTLPDGTHAIADSVIHFGAKPFEADRQMLEARADGPARGATSRQLQLVEFADAQCETCKAAMPTMEQLATDFPQARIVYQPLPQPGRPFDEQAAAEGECVRHEKGDAAFFTYLRAIYELQDGLTADKLSQTLATAATKAGANAPAAAACAATPAARVAVDASAKLGNDLSVATTPLLFVNGRAVPLAGISYDLLKRIVIFEAGESGMVIPAQPSLKSLQ